jgi:hypothetical protein
MNKKELLSCAMVTSVRMCTGLVFAEPFLR